MTSERPGGRFVTTRVEVEGRVEMRVVEVPDRELTPWDAAEALRVVGQPVPRVDAFEKVTGQAVYTADVVRPGMLHAVLVRSPIAAGTITMDTTDALQVPGVIEILGGSDLPRGMKVSGIPLLPRDVSWAGQPIAVVCADTRDAAQEGARRVRLTWEARTPVLTVADATAPDATRVKPSGNVMRGSPQMVERGDVTRGFAEADVIVERTTTTNSQLHSAMEPHGAVAEWEGDRLTIWESTQGIFRVRSEMATALGVPASHVRVIKEHMGGGFGAKNNAGAHTLLAAFLARRHRRAVRCVNDRFGEQTDSGHRPASFVTLRAGARRDGTLTAIEATCEVPLGAGGWDASVAAILHEMYACPNVKTTETFVFVHQQPMQAFRAPGHAEGAFALEGAMDELARRLGVDALELRRRNFAGHDQRQDRPYTANGLMRCYEAGAARFGWEDREERRSGTGGGDLVVGNGEVGAKLSSGGGPRPRESANTQRGFGMAAQVWGAGGGPPAYATVRLHPDGSVDVLSGTQDLGTGSRTILAQIAAEGLGAALKDVRVILGDTERTPYAGNSWGSMTTASVGPAVRGAAEEALDRLKEAAAQMLECSPADLVASDSTLRTRDGARSLSFADVTRKLGNVMIMGQGSRGPNPVDVGLMSFGAHFAEVDVDLDTLRVTVRRIVAAHDVGRVINPLLASSQLEGGVLMGLGWALGEERVLDHRTGVPVNPSLHDYKLPLFGDCPRIDAWCIDDADPAANPIGARGLAEPPVIPAAAAIANAVADALGVSIREIPMTPARLLHALTAAS